MEKKSLICHAAIPVNDRQAQGFMSADPLYSAICQTLDRFCDGLSQCSTVVRNTVVRATIKVNGKHPTLGTRRP